MPYSRYLIAIHEPRGAGPAASEAVWTAERTNVFNKLYLQTDSRLLPRRRHGRTRIPRGTRCRSVARGHLIPVYRPPDLTMKRNSRRRAASPFSFNHRAADRSRANSPGAGVRAVGGREHREAAQSARSQ